MEQPRELSTEVSMLPHLKDTKIELPEIQREGQRWNLSQKQSLIDSIYNKFPIPPLYFREEMMEAPIWWQIDGQQRLETITDFLANKFSLAKDAPYLPEDMRGKLFRNLTAEQKGRILGRTINYVVVVCSDEEEEEMFLRLNQGTPLTPAETRNAIRGEFNQTAKKLAKHKFMQKIIATSKPKFAHDAFCAQLMLLVSSDVIIDIRDRHLSKAYKVNKIYDKKDEVVAEITKFFDWLYDVFKIKNSYLVRHTVHSYYLIFRYMGQNDLLDKISDKELLKFFLEFEGQRKFAKLNPDKFDISLAKLYFAYTHLSSSGIDDGSTLQQKAKMLFHHLVEVCNLKIEEVKEEEEA